MVVRADLEDGDSDGDDDVDAADLSNWQSQYSPRLSADFDLNLTVGGDDFLTWQRGQGTPAGAGFADGDADEDGDVDGHDLAIWQAAYSQSRTAPAATTDDGSDIPAALAASTANQDRLDEQSQTRTARASAISMEHSGAVDAVLSQNTDLRVPSAFDLRRLALVGATVPDVADVDHSHRPPRRSEQANVTGAFDAPIADRVEDASRSRPLRRTESARERVFGDAMDKFWPDADVEPAADAVDVRMKGLL